MNTAPPGKPGDLGQPSERPDLRVLFHRLNNELGIILSHAELLQAKATDHSERSRAAQVVASVLDAMSTANEIRLKVSSPTS
jgi:hypothetical protein